MTRALASGALCALALSLCACRPAPTPTLSALVTKADLAAGAVLSEEDLELRPLPADPAAADVVQAPDLAKAVGLRLKVAARAGAPLRWGALGADEHLGYRVQRKGRALTLPVAGAEWVAASDHVDVLGSLTDPQSKETMTLTVLQNVLLLKVGPPAPAAPGGEATRPVTFLVQPEEAEILVQAARSGALLVAARNPEDVDVREERGRATLTTLLTGERANALMRKRLATQPQGN